MRYRPKRENYDNGVYGEIDYQKNLEKYCTYLENQNKQLTLTDVVKSLKDKETPHFYDWLKENKTDFFMDKLLFKGDWYFIGDLYVKYKKEFNIPF